MEQFLSMWPECFLIVATLVLLLIQLFLPKHQMLFTHLGSSLIVVLMFCLSLWELQQPPTEVFNDLFLRDHFTTWMEILGCITLFFIFTNSYSYVKRCEHLGTPEYYLLTLFSFLGFCLLVGAGNLLMIYLGLELLSLPLYALIAMRRHHAKATEAGLKYFIIGAIASGCLLYGMSMLYGAVGSLDINTLAHSLVASNFLTVLGLVFIMVGVAFKLGAVPFHAWMPDVYEGSPLGITLYLSTIPKFAAFALIVHLFIQTLPDVTQLWQPLLIFLSLASLIVGNVLALTQQNVKRLLAYSGIAHMGYVLLGIVAVTPEGYTAALFYMVSYVAMSLAAFSVLTLMSYHGIECETLEHLRGLNSRNSWLAFLMLLILFSMAGIPPLVGFFAKVLIFQALIHAHLVWLAAVGLACAIVGLYYYLRIIRVLYFDAPHTHAPLAFRVSGVFVSVNSLALLFFGIFPTFIYAWCVWGLQ